MKFLKEFCLVLCIFTIHAFPADDPVELSKRAGKMLNDWVESGKMGNPEEQGPYFEGDIMLPKDARGGIIKTSAKWKDAKVPYVLEGSFSE
jgi:hypothetical protein